ncbi:hypothetical protein PGB90_009580 [Kerria lacca]
MNLMEKWKKFFCDAGIPLSEASTYAYKFAHNRIQTNMLADLNKDYLKEMGITILGDVIAILRHSKQVYEEIQNNEKIEFPDENKESQKEIEQLKPKKQINRTMVKTVSKLSSKPTPVRISEKRKLETSSVQSKKKVVESKKVIHPNTDLNNENIEECEDLGYVMIDSTKKASFFNQKISSNVEKQLKTVSAEKKPEKLVHGIESDFVYKMSEDDDDDDDHVEVIINEPIVTPFNNHKKFLIQDKYETVAFPISKAINMPVDVNKRAVFKRLGDDISQPSVSSTTAFDEDEQNAFVTKKFKEDIAKISQEKNSVFHRLGQKCDVSSTSVDVCNEEKKSIIHFDFMEAASKPKIQLGKNKILINRKVKVTEDVIDPSLCLPACVKSTYSEGILASNSSHDRKLSLKERLGSSKGLKATSNEYVNNYLFRKSYPPTDVYSNKPTTGKKKVSFGSVSEKLIPSREEAIESGELAATSERISVFDRLGFNRTF